MQSSLAFISKWPVACFFYIANRSKDKEGIGPIGLSLSFPPPCCLPSSFPVVFGIARNSYQRHSRLSFCHFSCFVSLSSGKPKGCLLCFFASVPTIITSFLSLLFLVLSLSHIGKEKEDEETRKNHLHIFLYSYLFYVLLFLLSFKTGRGLFFLPSHSSVCFPLSCPTRKGR